MRDASGLNRMRYADTLRAIGSYLDLAFFRDLTMVETSQGFVVTGQSVMTTQRRVDVRSESLLLADADIDELVQQAFTRRGAAIPSEANVPTFTVGELRMRYQDVLRSIGMLIDERNWRSIAIVQTGSGFLLKGHFDDAAHDLFLDGVALRRMLDQLRDQRDSQRHNKLRFWSRQ